KGIALVLGERGATVYVTGRSVRREPPTLGRPGTIDDTAEEVTARGGSGIAIRCDHTDDAQVEALFERIRGEQGRLDVLVNNAWSGYELPLYFEALVLFPARVRSLISPWCGRASWFRRSRPPAATRTSGASSWPGALRSPRSGRTSSRSA